MSPKYDYWSKINNYVVENLSYCGYTCAFFQISCTKSSDNVELYYEESLLNGTTKSSIKSDSDESFVFIATEKDVRDYIRTHTPGLKVCTFDSIDRDGVPMLYIVNFEDGWAVYSADKRMPPIIAENENGFFNWRKTDNPGVKGWISEITDAISVIRQNESKETVNDNTNLWEGKLISKIEYPRKTRLESPLYTWTKIPVSQIVQGDSVQTYGPYLSTKWGQTHPWNGKLPIYAGNTHYKTGCVAVAVSQLLYYYHNTIGTPSGLYHDITVSGWTYHPQAGDTPAHYTSTLTRENYTYNSNRWNQMLPDLTAYNPYSPSSVDGANYVSDLMVDVGNRVSMKYKADGSSSWSDILKAQTALPYYGLNGTLGAFNSSPVVSNLQQQHPCYMRGYDIVQDGGHAWVVDGVKIYRQIILTTYEWIQGYVYGEYPNGEPATSEEAVLAAMEEWGDKPEDGMITHEYSYSIPYRYSYHMNWGWGGSYDGFFYSVNDLTVGGYQFTTNQQVLYNIH